MLFRLQAKPSCVQYFAREIVLLSLSHSTPERSIFCTGSLSCFHLPVRLEVVQFFHGRFALFPLAVLLVGRAIFCTGFVSPFLSCFVHGSCNFLHGQLFHPVSTCHFACRACNILHGDLFNRTLSLRLKNVQHFARAVLSCFYLSLYLEVVQYFARGTALLL